MTEDELTALQNQSVAVMAASLDSPTHALTPAGEAVVLAVPALCDEVRAVRAALGDLYAYTVELEGAMAPWLITRPHMARLPGTQDGRNALGERMRELLDPATG
jgi:hypothetical protein